MNDTYININTNMITTPYFQDHLLDLGLDLDFVLVLATHEM